MHSKCDTHSRVEMPADRGRPPDPCEETLAGLAAIHRTIVQSGAQTVLLARHAPSYALNWTQPLAQVVRDLATDLQQVEINGSRHPVLVVPVGAIWLDATARFGIDGWYSAPLHGNKLAQYTSGCMIFTYLTGRDPRQNRFRGLPLLWSTAEDSPAEQVSEEDARWIKEQVWLYYTARK